MALRLRFIPLLLTLLTAPLTAAEPPTAYDRINLAVSAGEEVDNDTLSATLFVQHEGKDPAELAAQVNRSIQQAVETARRQDGVRVQTLDYQTQPIYHTNTLSGWRIRQSIRLESREVTAISRLLGKLQQRLSIGGIHYRLSPERRQEIEKRLIGQAIRRFKARAQQITQEMGYRRYRLVEMTIRPHGDAPQPYPRQTMSLRAESAPTLEAGRQRVEVHIDGTIELKPE